MSGKALRIGEAAVMAGVSADTLRYYERRGVVPAAVRTASGYRMYSEAAVARIQFVRNALRFGFSLEQIARFTHARDEGRPPCREVRGTGDQILGEMDRQIAELTAARDAIRKTLREWDERLAGTPAGRPAHLLASLGHQAGLRESARPPRVRRRP